MATDPKKPQPKKSEAKAPDARKPARNRAATAKANGPVVRKVSDPKAPSPVPPEAVTAKAPQPKAATPAPVLANAVKPEEKLPEAALMDRAVDSIEKSLKAAVPAAVAVNCKLVDIAQANMNSGLELARDLASAKSPMEMMRLQMNYWHEHMGVFQAQAQELRMLSAEFVTTTSEPIRAHIRGA